MREDRKRFIERLESGKEDIANVLREFVYTASKEDIARVLIEYDYALWQAEKERSSYIESMTDSLREYWED